MIDTIKITKIMMLRVIITSVISFSIFIFSLAVFSESEIENKSIIAKISYVGGLPVYNSKENKNKDFITIYNDKSLRVFFPGDSKGEYKVIKLPVNRINKILDKILSSRITDDDYIGYRFYHNQVDAGYLRIKVYFNGNVYSLGTRLPYLEKQANVVITDKGEHLLENNETKEKYISEHSSEDYKRFRNAWDQCFNVLDDLYLEITGERIVRMEKPK
jgi:hypothetical protein